MFAIPSRSALNRVRTGLSKATKRSPAVAYRQHAQMTAIHRDDTRRRQQSMSVKVVLTQTEGAPHFALLDDLEIEGLRIVQVSTPEELATEIGDADVLYGFPTADLLRAAKSLR